MNSRAIMGNLERSIPHSSPKAVWVAQAIRRVFVIFQIVQAIVLVLFIANFQTYSQEMVWIKILISIAIALSIPITILIGAMTAIFYESIADISVDIRRLRLIKQMGREINWSDE
ncbi:hypothetical protein KBY79_05995 [Synechococcus lacustris C3-12m-Tous]|uniref:hypothetical protein n=1 Tax=Synechococcus lacustris TaxID=2116544 RepID=UPI0020CCAA0C|nr:hypothetical protein [Synechococcus lacustris]MCP9924768.1 hypothetical protein [Synechococcus lacustris C3-12m-Tous]